MSVRHLLVLVSIPALLAACSTTKESPIYQQSTKYKVHSPYSTTTGTATTQQAGYTTTYQTPTYQTQTYQAPTQPTVTYTTHSSAPAYHQTASSTGEIYTTQVNHECLDKESDRKLIGTAIGGAAGALAGNKIGDNTTGTIIGGVVGAAAGYGIADVTTNCDPIPVAAPATTSAPIIYQGQQTTQTTPYQTVASTTTTAPIVTQTAPMQQTATTSMQGSTAPTDSAYGETYGTPGYHAMIANGELDETTTASVSLPEPAPTIAPTPIPEAAPVPSYPQANMQTPSYPQASIPAPAPVQSYPQITTPAPAPSYQYTEAGITLHQVVEGDTVYSLSRRLCVGVEDIKRLNSLNSEFYIRLDDMIKLPASRC